MFCLNFNHLFFVPWVFRLWDAIISLSFYLNLVVYYFGFSSLGHDPSSNLSFFFVPLVFHLLATILFILCSFSFSSLGHHPRFCVNLIICSFGFFSLGDYPWFYLNLFFLHLVSHHWGTILGSILVYSLLLFFSSFEHHPTFYLSFFFVTFVSHP